jgi:uncharacterized iron-regulated protein
MAGAPPVAAFPGARQTTAASLLVWLAVGCGGAYHKPETLGGVKGVEAAALPYTILDGRTGRQVEDAEFMAKLATAKVVCVGEEHPNPHHHWAQLEVVAKMTPAGRHPQLALAMEMFQRPFQAVLDDFAASRIDEAALLSRTGWAERWGYDYAMYRPILARMINAGGSLLALNPAKELVKRVSRQGLESLTAEERAALPELKLDDAAHRAWFDGVMAEMGGSQAHTAASSAASSPAGSAEEPAVPNDEIHAGLVAPSADRIYTVQVLWDESMADGAVRWVRADPSHRAIVIAGNGHCHDSAVVGRIKRRGVAEVISIRPVVDVGEDDVAAALAKPMNDFLFVMTMPQAATTAR